MIAVAPLRLVLLAALAASVACSYTPSFTECEVQCAEGACPSGMSCRSDGYCHAGAQGGAFTACTPEADAAVMDAAGTDAAAISCVDSGPLTGMVHVPCGPFVMGSDPDEGETDEEPEHIVDLSSFYIDVHEVTNAEWRACVTGGGCTQPSSADSSTRTGYYTNPTYDDYPVIFVSWMQASEYCAWAGKRLPTEAEWEKAARGGCEINGASSCGSEDERTYPWGNDPPTCSLANYKPGTACVGDTDAVGARSPAGDSPYGAQDMAGNVWEWVADWYASDYYSLSPSTDPTGPETGTARVVWGGSWYDVESNLRVANRGDGVPTARNNYLGARCARTP